MADRRANDVQKQIRYLTSCYRADNRETAITDFFSEKVTHRIVLSGSDDLLNGLFPKVPIDYFKAVEAKKAAAIAKREKSLLYGAFFLVGSIRSSGSKRINICAPLLLFPAEIGHTEDGAWVTIDFGMRQINTHAIRKVLNPQDESAAAHDDLFAHFPPTPLEPDGLNDLINLLEDNIPGVSTEAMYDYPQLLDEKQFINAVKAAQRARSKIKRPNLQCLPVGAVGLVKNSPDTRGMLAELSTLAHSTRFSTPLMTLFANSTKTPEPVKTAPPVCVPTVLSAAQRRALESILRADLTLIIGPPGTGKSYTIAALALDQMARGKSVIVASRMDQAVNVVGDKIEGIIQEPGYAVRAGRKQYLKSLKQFLISILDHSAARYLVAPSLIDETENQLNSQRRLLAKLERQLRHRAKLECHFGATQPSATTGVLSRLGHKLAHTYWRARLTGKSPFWQIAELYTATLEQRNQSLARLLKLRFRQQISWTLDNHRDVLKELLRAVSARTELSQSKLFSSIDMSIVLKIFPIWLVSFADIHQVLPFEPELFDLAIVDEATQCDMASALPIFQRAKRVAVSGDPRQLRHVSFLSQQRQRGIAAKCRLADDDIAPLNYRDESLLDLVDNALKSGRQVAALDEHFRSMPDIIQFSNQEFYGNRLKVLSARPQTLARRNIEICPTGGSRNAQGQNKKEAEALIGRLKQLIAEESGLDAGKVRTIGILSPFRAQVDHLRRTVEKRCALDEILKHQIQVGTAHSFQGEERDVMLLSFALDDQSHSAAYRFIDQPDVFNVSVTRARSHQIVFTSFEMEVLNPGSLLYRYLEMAVQRCSLHPDVDPLKDQFLTQVAEQLKRHGFTVWPDYIVAGVDVDLVVERCGRTLGIDLIGHPGKFAGLIDLEYYRTFQRAGLSLFPLPYSAWQKNREHCVESLITAIEREDAGYPPDVMTIAGAG